MENKPLIIEKRPGRPVGQSDDLNKEELERIIALPDRRTKEGLRDYAVLLALANTPMRKGELVALNCGDVVNDGDKKFLTYRGLKKRSKKPYWLRIPVNESVFEGITKYIRIEHRKHRPKHDTPLFMTLGKHGPYSKRRITPDAVDLIVSKYTRLAGISKRITPHSFRASYLTLRKHHGAASLLPLSGHNDFKGLTPYMRSTEEESRSAALEFSFS